MLDLNPEHFAALALLVMGVLSFYCGSLSQENWNAICYRNDHRNPLARKITKYAGPVLIVVSIGMLAGVVPV